MPQQITEENVISPLAPAVFDNVQVDCPDVPGRLDDKQVASRISMIAPVTVADVGQPTYEFRHRFERHYCRNDV